MIGYFTKDLVGGSGSKQSSSSGGLTGAACIGVVSAAINPCLYYCMCVFRTALVSDSSQSTHRKTCNSINSLIK